MLHDIDEARLETAGRIGARINEAKGGRATIETQLDRRKALDGADYAINEIQVGGRDAFLIDFAIPESVRRASDDRRHAGDRRHLARAAHAPGDDRHRERHGGRVPRRDAAELHEPDGDGAMGGVRGLTVRPRRRPVPLGLLHPRVPGRDGRRADGRDRVPDVGLQPPGVRHAVRARRRGPLPGARRCDRCRPRRARSPRPGPALQGTGVLPDRVERALRGVRVVVHAPRRSDRAVPHPGRRLHRTHRRGVGGLSRDRAQARGG